MKENLIILSFSDYKQALKAARWMILLSAAIFAVLLFCYFLLKPPRFTAEGIFKGSTQTSASNFSRALEFLGASDSYIAVDDPNVFLHSYPVMEEVVRELHLQLNIGEKGPRGGIFRQVWHTLKAERAQRFAKSKRPSSQILNLPVASQIVFPDRKAFLECKELAYPGEMSCNLSLFFTDENHFQVKHKKRLIGEGELRKPFHWDGGSFTLASAAPIIAGNTFLLTFVPLHAAALSLKNSLEVKKSKENSSLIVISYTHSNRHMATSIVNSTMTAFQKYLQSEGERKISKQLDYLQHRQEETFGGLENVMKEHKAYLESQLSDGEMFLLENELQFMSQKQGEVRHHLDVLASEMQRLYQLIHSDDRLSFDGMLTSLRQQNPFQVKTLTVESARSLIHNQAQALDTMCMEQAQYDFCLSKLSEPAFDFSSLSKVVGDPLLQERFNTIHSLHRNIIDAKNWTAKERAQLTEQLETERLFLTKHIHDLKEGAELKSNVLKSRLAHLQEELLYLLLDQYEDKEESLRELALQAANFPQKWLRHQKIELNQKMQTEMIESITNLIEAKNIGYHLNCLTATPLMSAFTPVFPDPPRLTLAFLVGGLLGAVLVSVFVVLREVWKGPTASYTNLKSEGWPVIAYHHSLDDLKKIHYHLKNRGKVLSIIGKNPSFAHDLATLFAKAKEKVLLIDLTRCAEEQKFIDTSFGQELIISKQDSMKEVYLASKQFAELLEKQKKDVDHVVLYSDAPLNSLESQLLTDLADYALICMRNERWADLPTFSEKFLYISESYEESALSFEQIVPFLERVTSFWDGSQKPKTQEPAQTQNDAFSDT